MKKALLLLLYVGAATGLKAQEFAPKSAIWHYSSKDDQMSRDLDYSTIQYNHDTIIKGQTWKVLNLLSYDDDNKLGKKQLHFVIRQDSTIVRLWIDTFANVLYDFNMKKGDTIVYQDSAKDYLGKPYTYYIYLQSVDSITISGKSRARFHCKMNMPQKPDADGADWTVIEGIGAEETFIPNYLLFSYPLILNMRCYQDSTLFFQAPAPSNWNFVWRCDSTINFTSIVHENLMQNNEWRVTPNPFSNILHLSYTGSNKEESLITINIYSITGKLVYETRGYGLKTTEELNLSEIAPGLYFLKIQSLYSQTILKVIKN